MVVEVHGAFAHDPLAVEGLDLRGERGVLELLDPVDRYGEPALGGYVVGLLDGSAILLHEGGLHLNRVGVRVHHEDKCVECLAGVVVVPGVALGQVP